MADLVETGWRLMVASCCDDVCTSSSGCGCAEKIGLAIAAAEAKGYSRGVEAECNRLLDLYERDPEQFATVAAIRALPADKEGA